MVFRGDDGLDEMTISTTSSMWWVAQGRITEVSLAPEDVGLSRAPLESLRGGVATENAEVVRRLLAGEPGPVRDAVLLNAGTALALAGRDGAPVPADEVAEVVRAGVQRAAAVIDDGSAAGLLERWVAVSTDDALLGSTESR